MLHLIKYSYKFKIRNFSIMFWPLVFPLILGLFFKMAFGNLGQVEDMDPIPVAVVLEEESEESLVFDDFLTEMEEQKTPMVQTERVSEEKALNLLKDKEVSGIYYVKEDPKLTVGGTGYNENILETILESYTNNKNVLMDIAEDHPEKIAEAAEELKEYQEYTQSVSVNGKTLDFVVMFFYALIGMACMYGGFIGHFSVSNLQANLTAVGARRCVTPTHKLKLILCELLTAFSMHFFNLLIDIYVLKYVFDIAMDGSMGYMILVVLFGSLIGVSFGICITSVAKLGEGAKIGIILAFSMIGSMFAGLYSNNIKFEVDQHAPIINKLNPASLISDSFYCINVYNDGSRLTTNLITLFVISVILIAVSFFAIRRECYDSI